MIEFIRVPCGHCSGDGYVVHERMTQALRALSSVYWTSTTDLAKKLKLKPTNVSNLTAELLKLGHVERRGSGSRHSVYEWKRKR